MTTQQQLLDKIQDEFRAIVNKHFPNYTSSGYGYAGPQFHITLSDQAASFDKTPYYYSDELKFIHWTCIDNLISIINNREIRLYNLVNSDDEQEFLFSAKSLDLSDDRIRLIKENFFSFFILQT